MSHLLYWYAFFGILLVFSILWLWFSAGGFDIARVMEKQLGSLVMQQYFPNQPDRFQSAVTMVGLWKKTWPHALAFGLYSFVFLHLIRSLSGQPRWLIYYISLCYSALVLELISPFLFWIMPPLWASYCRIIIFIVFILQSASQAVLLWIMAARQHRIAFRARVQ